jgi:hypothetical protein
MNLRLLNLGAGLAAGLLIGTAVHAAEVPDFANFDYGDTVHPEDVQEKLQALGFTDIGPVDEEGQVFTADAEWEGRPITVRVDADTGWIRNNWNEDPLGKPRYVRFTTPADVTAEDVAEKLTQIGFTNVTAEHDEGDVYHVNATWQNHPYDMTLNVDTGTLWDTDAVMAQTTPPDFMNVPYPKAATPDEIRRKLAALGYSNIGDVEKKGQVFETTAAWQGDNMELTVDADTGLIRMME